MDLYRVQAETIDVTALLSFLEDAAAGAQAVFLGVVRNEFSGRASAGLEYDAYVPLAEKEMRRIGAELKSEFDVRHIVMVHRTGHLAVGEVSVVVAVSTPHRPEAFAACREGIDRLKVRVPIFKRELWQDGAGEWHGVPGGPRP